MIYKALLESKKKRDFQNAEVAETTVLGAMKMCVVETQDRPPLSTVSLGIRFVTVIILGGGVVTSNTQRAAMRAVVRPSMIKSASNVLLKNDNLMTLIANFVSNYVEKESTRVKDEEDSLPGSKKRSVSYRPRPRPRPWTCWMMTTIRSKREKLTRTL